MIVCILLYVSSNTCVLNERILDLEDRKIVSQIEIPYYFRGKLEQLANSQQNLIHHDITWHGIPRIWFFFYSITIPTSLCRSNGPRIGKIEQAQNDKENEAAWMNAEFEWVECCSVASKKAASLLKCAILSELGLLPFDDVSWWMWWLHYFFFFFY